MLSPDAILQLIVDQVASGWRSVIRPGLFQRDAVSCLNYLGGCFSEEVRLSRVEMTDCVFADIEEARDRKCVVLAATEHER